MTRSTSRAALVALLSLPGLGPARLAALGGDDGDWVAAWCAVRCGDLGGVDLRASGERLAGLRRAWIDAASAIDLDEVLPAHHRAGIAILTPEDAAWPRRLRADPEPPPVLFVRGDPSYLDRITVAVVGTRRCTANGAATATELGRGLGAAGVPVVSGLALGVDGLAHRGVIEADGVPVGVVATGLDRIYPARHADLWRDVAERGVLVSEAGLGVGPERWRFPCRNRLVAAFASTLVVVESGVRGGSLSTVDEALRREVPVLAVPGPVRSPQSAGTNQLLYDGAALVRDTADVLAELGLAVVPVAPVATEPLAADLDATTRAVLERVSPSPAPLGDLVAASGLPFAEAATALARLEARGIVQRTAAGYQRVVG